MKQITVLVLWILAPVVALDYDTCYNIQNAGFFSAPTYYDFNGDNVRDLVVGCYESSFYDGSMGKVEILLNNGSEASPLFERYGYLEAGGDTLIIGGSG